MKRSFKSLFVLIFVLVSFIINAMGVTPAYAASSMEVVPLSLPDNWRSGYLYGVWGSGANDVYAVGYGYNGSNDLPLLYHKDSSGWSASGLPLPSNWRTGYLFGVWGSSANDVYAVGYGYNGSAVVPLLYHNNGSSWEAFTLGLPGGVTSGSLSGIWGSGPNDIYAVGYGYTATSTVPLLYYKGSGDWSAVAVSPPAEWSSVKFKSVWGSGTEVYAIGTGYRAGGNRPLLYSLSGGSWNTTELSLPGEAGSGYLSGLWGSSTTSVYALGYGYSGTTPLPLLYNKSGSTWTQANSSLPGELSSGFLYSIWGSGDTDVYAVGSGGTVNNSFPLMYQKGSDSWSDSSPSLPVGWISGSLFSVWGSGVGDVYAVGSGDNGSTDLPLLYHSSEAGQDVVAPGDVDETTFTATSGTTNGSIDLSWEAPADDDGNSVAAYLVKYSTSPFMNWSNGTAVTDGLPTPTTPGTTQTMTVSGLNPGTVYYFTIRAQDEQYNLSVNYAEASATAQAGGAGTYDDSEWVYSSGWGTLNASGAYGGSIRYSSAINNWATFQFQGSSFELIYTTASDRGQMDVYVDNGYVGTINAYNPSMVLQTRWSKAVTPGTHTVKVVHKSGSYVDIDAIEILSSDAPGEGTYDDGEWVYSSGWGTLNASGAYGGSIRYSGSLNNWATFTFQGSGFDLIYTTASDRGQMDVYVDDGYIGTINAYSSSMVYQTRWSRAVTPGTHTVKVVHKSGSYVDIDAIEILNSDVPGEGTYDDSDWVYSANWGTLNTSGAYAGGIHYSGAVNDWATFQFQGSGFILIYTIASDRGQMDVFVDDAYIGTINAYNSTMVYQTHWSRSVSPGTHTVKVVHKSGTYVDIDAIEILNSVAPGEGTYDDGQWVYSSGWGALSVSDAYGGGIHYSAAPNNWASFTFEGSSFDLIYTIASDRGQMDVYLDDAYVGTINAYNPSMVFQTHWNRAVTPGTHTVKVVHKSGAYVDIDAIEILNSSVPGEGTYDDSDWVYSANWGTLSSVGAYGGSIRYSSAINNWATFQFQGSSFTLIYTIASDRGQMDVLVDDQYSGTINAYNPSMVYQTRWSKAVTPGIHTVKVVHKSGSYVDIDAIEILNSDVLGEGTYDDTDWSYSANWGTLTLSGAYGGGIHYSGAVNDWATFQFEGSGFDLIYTITSDRGQMDIFVDNIYAGTINAYSPTMGLQTRWSQAVTPGTHTVKVVHKSGAYVDIDAIQISP